MVRDKELVKYIADLMTAGQVITAMKRPDRKASWTVYLELVPRGARNPGVRLAQNGSFSILIVTLIQNTHYNKEQRTASLPCNNCLNSFHLNGHTSGLQPQSKVRSTTRE